MFVITNIANPMQVLTNHLRIERSLVSAPRFFMLAIDRLESLENIWAIINNTDWNVTVWFGLFDLKSNLI